MGLCDLRSPSDKAHAGSSTTEPYCCLPQAIEAKEEAGCSDAPEQAEKEAEYCRPHAPEQEAECPDHSPEEEEEAQEAEYQPDSQEP